MRESAENYARAFIFLLEKYPHEQDRLIAGLKKALRRAGDERNAKKVIAAIEDAILRKEGKKKITVTSARPLSKESLDRIYKQFETDAVFETKVQPDLIAGVRVMINREQLIDATLKRKLGILFSTQ